jgi:hypothetical protein
VGEFLDQWIDAASSGLRASTAASYRMLLVKRVTPRIGRIRRASLTPGHLTKLYATLLAEGGKGSAPLSVDFTVFISEPKTAPAAGPSPSTT